MTLHVLMCLLVTTQYYSVVLVFGH